MKTKILTLLRDSREFISGQDLCERFGVSRTAVWKAINQLKKEGYEIEAVPNKGYQLVSMPDSIGANELLSRMHTRWVAKEINYYDSIGSTNVQAKHLAEQGAKHGLLLVANMQTAGKGRRGRAWESPAGANIYFTLLLRPELTPANAPMLTLVMALAVAKAVEKVCGVTAGIKWPNDIVVNGKKIVGILTEMSVEEDRIGYVVIGVGINVGLQTFSEELFVKATSLEAEVGHKVVRAELLEYIMEDFEEEYGIFMRDEDLSGLLEDYNDRLVNRNAQVRVLDPLGEYNGIAKGIDPQGELLVETADGEVKKVYAGEVSVRGIYGYV